MKFLFLALLWLAMAAVGGHAHGNTRSQWVLADSSSSSPVSSSPVFTAQQDDDADSLQLLGSIAHWIRRGLEDLRVAGRVRCQTCRSLVGSTQLIAKRTLSAERIQQISTEICVRFRIQSPDVCESIVPKFGPWFLQVLTHPDFDASHFCGAINYCRVSPPLWHPEFPKTKPKQRRHSGPVKADGPRRKILHFSDWHFDPEYRVGYEAACPDPICCRAPHSPQPDVDITRPAGKFGDFRCDTPLELARSVLSFAMRTVPDADFVVMTGDLPPHDVWLSSFESVVETEKAVADDLWASFGPRKIPVFMTIGNHENSLPNSFPSHAVPANNITNLYSALAQQWSHWLTEEARLTMSEFGFYSIRRPQDNLRIISLNTNHAYLLNWWIYLAPYDPDNMLKWLISELQHAEDLNEDVIIIGHIPPGGADVNKYWSAAFYDIVARYEDTIVSQFYGHVHRDEFQIFYSNDSRVEPISVAYAGPSITPYHDLNPGFRVYEMDKASNQLVNHFTYVLDLEKSNVVGEPQWNLEYDAKSAYGMEGVLPADWHDLTERMLRETLALPTPPQSPDDPDEDPDDDDPEEDRKTLASRSPAFWQASSSFGQVQSEDLLDKYLWFKMKSSTAQTQTKCDKKCKLKVICQLKSAKSFFPCKKVDLTGGKRFDSFDNQLFDGSSFDGAIEAWRDLPLC